MKKNDGYVPRRRWNFSRLLEYVKVFSELDSGLGHLQICAGTGASLLPYGMRARIGRTLAEAGAYLGRADGISATVLPSLEDYEQSGRFSEVRFALGGLGVFLGDGDTVDGHLLLCMSCIEGSRTDFNVAENIVC